MIIRQNSRRFAVLFFMAGKVSETAEGVTLAVKVVPRAVRNEVVGWEGDALKVRLKAPPVEGRANEALIGFLAKTLGVARSQVEIVRGDTSRHKRVRVRGVSASSVWRALGTNKGET